MNENANYIIDELIGGVVDGKIKVSVDKDSVCFRYTSEDKSMIKCFDNRYIKRL